MATEKGAKDAANAKLYPSPSMIWPVSDCEYPVELVVIPNYHVPATPQGYLAVQTSTYFAWWTDRAPGYLNVRRADGEGESDWVELALEPIVHCGEPGAATSGVGIARSEVHRWRLDPSLPLHHVARGDSASAEWVAADTPEGFQRVRIDFYPDRIIYQAIKEFPVSTRLWQVRLAAGTRPAATCLFDPNPATHGVFYHPLHRLHNDRGRWFTPPPFACCFRLADRTWCIASVETEVSQLLFSRFYAESTPRGGVDFVLDYPSGPEVSGCFRSPALVWRFGFDSEFAALRAHAEGMVQAGLAVRPRRSPALPARATMVCGWHRQVELATLARQALQGTAGPKAEGAAGAPRPQDYARQDVYEEHVADYEQAGIPFDVLTIDHGWSVTEGDWTPDPAKWPDLAGFVRARHREGRKVLLWVCSLSIGLPPEECLRVGSEGHTRLDPDNPLWRARLARSLAFLLGSGPGAVGADGLKFDFTAPMSDPRPAHGSGTVLHGYQYLHRLFEVVSTEARRLRPDCLLDYQCANPQFAALHDMTRLNDFFLPQPQAVRVMQTRAAIARAAAFDPLIDTDGPSGLAYLEQSSRFGLISLYLTRSQLRDPAVVEAVKRNQRRG